MGTPLGPKYGPFGEGWHLGAPQSLGRGHPHLQVFEFPTSVSMPQGNAQLGGRLSGSGFP